MFDPAVGKFLSEDPLDFEDDLNLSEYVDNNPVNFTDPTGTLAVEDKGRIPNVNPSIDPTARTNLAGSNWQWVWQPGDLPSIAQRVSLSGSFAVSDDCGLTQKVSWTENYIEVWTKGSTKLDFHRARPQKPALYLEQQSGWNFQKKGTQLFIKKGNETREVLGWSFSMDATFEVVNGFYPTWDVPTGSVYTSKNDFQITNLLVDNAIKTPRASNVFSSMLFPTGYDTSVPGFPPDQVVGQTLTARDNWRIQWWHLRPNKRTGEDQPNPTPSVEYTTTG